MKRQKNFAWRRIKYKGTKYDLDDELKHREMEESAQSHADQDDPTFAHSYSDMSRVSTMDIS